MSSLAAQLMMSCCCCLQDFWNVDASGPLVHAARFFYGPMLQVGGPARVAMNKMADVTGRSWRWDDAAALPSPIASFTRSTHRLAQA